MPGLTVDAPFWIVTLPPAAPVGAAAGASG
jgi:hypothetical protein